MKYEDLKIVQKWREYAGPKDERLEAESAKIYKISFVLLSFGMLMIFFYQFIARQVAWVHSYASEMPHGFATPFEAAMYLWLVLVMLICAGLQTRKGYVDTNRFGQTEHLPVGYFLLVSGLSGAAFTLVIAAMRCIAEAQTYHSKASFGWRTWPRACSAVRRFSRPRLLACAQRFSRRKDAVPSSRQNSTPLTISNAKWAGSGYPEPAHLMFDEPSRRLSQK